MNSIIQLYIYNRIDQISNFESVSSESDEKATPAENVESLNISKEFLEVLNISFELYAERETVLLKKKDLIDSTESKIYMLSKNINLEAEEMDTNFDDIVALAIIHFNMGVLYSGTETEKLFIRETHFTTSMKLLKGKELERKAILIIIRVLIRLFVISYIRGHPEESYSFLETAMELYSKYTKEEIEYPDPINFAAILGMDDEEESNSKILLENLQLTTLLHMATLYKENFHDKHKFVIYIHNILDQLIEIISCLSLSYYADWAAASSHLSQYFVHNCRFIEARNHMIAAEYMIKLFHEKVIEVTNEEDIIESYTTMLYKNYKIGYNSIMKLWGLYGVGLLTASTDSLLQTEEHNKSCGTDNSKSDADMESKEDFTKLLMFDVEKNFENFVARFPDKCMSNLNDVKVIFVDVLKCFSTVKEYFTIEEHPIDFLEIALATSKVYRYLASFEQDKTRQLILHRQQLKILNSYCQKIKKVQINPFILRQMLIRASNEIAADHIFLLEYKTHHLQLNIQQLRKDFTEKVKITINRTVTDIINTFRHIIEYFDVFAD